MTDKEKVIETLTGMGVKMRITEHLIEVLCPISCTDASAEIVFNFSHLGEFEMIEVLE